MRCLGRAVFLTDDLAVVVGAFAFTALRAVDRAAGLAALRFFTAACNALRDFAFLAMAGLPCCYGERLARNTKCRWVSTGVTHHFFPQPLKHGGLRRR